MAKVLVLGGKGFIGRHVAREFQLKGYEVIGLGHGLWPENEHKDWGISQWHAAELNIENLQALSFKPDIIVQAAGSSSVPFSIVNPYDDFIRTVKSTADLLEFVRIERLDSKIVYLSSAGVYGKVEKLPIDECAPTNPLSPYGVHKLMVENLCHEYAVCFGASISIVRLFSIYGQGLRKQLLWDACNKSLQGDYTYFGTGYETRDWLHISDAAKLIFVASQHASNDCPIFNGAVGDGVSVSELITQIYAGMNIKKTPIFNGVVREGDPTHYVADITKVVKLGWQPEVDWRAGVTDYVKWFLDTCSG